MYPTELLAKVDEGTLRDSGDYAYCVVQRIPSPSGRQVV